MRVLLVDVAEPLATRVRTDLSRRHRLDTFTGDVRDLDRCRQVADATDPVDVVIHGFDAAADPLDRLDCAGRGTWNLLTTTTASRYIQLSSMRLLSHYSAGWHVDEQWPPLPSTEVDDLAPHLAEIAARDICAARPIECLVLRLPDVVTAELFTAGPIEPDWLHIDDAVAAVRRAVECEPPAHPAARWRCYDIVRGDARCRFPLGAAAQDPFAFVPQHVDERPAEDVAEAPVFPPQAGPITGLAVPEHLLVLGAGGPLATVLARQLWSQRRLRLADRALLAQLSPRPGDPRPGPTTPPHEEVIVDVTDADAVRAAAADTDCIVNCTVVRPDPVQAFRVNLLGAYNVMRAAVDAGIPRVVHTGPAQTLAPHPVGYTDDRAIDAQVPPRPGDSLYGLSKRLGQEVCRLFAEHHAIACPTLLFVGFSDADGSASHGHPFTVSWPDAGAAMAAAVTVTRLPEPAPVLHVLADAPHDRYRNSRAREVLGWQPRDRLDRIWYRRR
jgi:nucleoside-diphosphate-sugar epimerase